ncbi:hypothetical protein PNH50_12195 [Leisingera aquaemixtae]|jgi:hypothetical protein|uniref:Uncharacterized protein n=1 Tax=Leisingera aquaemixtae TaxID=1396826 RepID=A0A0P1H583_9RHOB|nr:MULTISPECIES: hypothetical protein [Leisingera]QDI75178.1 hypothetical protein R2C4_05215 [Leisingera aquaemixtae]UWQ23716.1 hypothetical protein K3553_12085 [Leisingera aquaemixtae]UWQ36240.1 hypothetical protein K3552_11990 [Leisingera aquaemixtae]UWQ44600.1 hypothetical protein K3719_12425 [Leisingera aquaemixtae]CUH98088.1 hypothetical protein PHA8399_00195 [Leisingera aquaemixtae]
MSEHADMNEALAALTDKLRSLNDLVTANQFMVEALAQQGGTLQQLDASSSKAMLRRQARVRFHPETGTAPNAAVLAVLEEVLGRQQESAEIIPFPVRA